MKYNTDIIRLNQRFSNWGPLDGARGTVKKF